jgi:hypothetical protein
LSNVSIGNSVASIGASAFYNCSGLTTVTIPNSLLTIGVNAFSECSGLSNVSVGNSLTSIGNGAFYNCSNITSIVLPDSLTSLGEISFFACTSLNSVTLGNSVTTIGNQAFAWCNPLSNLTITTSTPPTINANVFEGLTLPNITLSVPSAFQTSYDAAPVWENFSSVTLNLTNPKLASLKIYPNPTIDKLEIEVPNSAKLENVSLYNINGQLLVKSTTSQLNTSSLLDGQYIINIETNQGSTVKKLIKASSK